jgi:hypothetical protein
MDKVQETNFTDEKNQLVNSYAYPELVRIRPMSDLFNIHDDTKTLLYHQSYMFVFFPPVHLGGKT